MGDDRWATSNSAYGGFWKGADSASFTVAAKKASSGPVAVFTPRVNPPRGRPADQHRRLLLERLAAYGLGERPMQGDGNCLFRSLADQL